MLNRIREIFDRVHLSKRTGFIVGGVLLVVIVLQILFPYDRAYFNASIDGQPVGLMTRVELQSFVDQRYGAAKVNTVNPVSSSSFKQAGIVVDNTETAKQATDYPVWQRLIPFSFVSKFFSSKTDTVVTYNSARLGDWAIALRDACKVAAVDADISVNNRGTLATVPSRKGRQCNEGAIVASLKATPLAPVMSVATRAASVAPKRSDGAVNARVKEIQSIVDQGVTVTILGTTTSALPNEIVSWLVFQDGKDGAITLDIDPDKVKSFIERAQKPIYIAPGTTVIRTIDGVESSRIDGAKGRGIDQTKLLEQLRTQFKEAKTTPIEAVTTELPAIQQVLASYTNSSAGLNALLADIAKEKGNMAISVRELAGQGRVAHANGAKGFHPASTYKLYVAYSMIKRVESGSLNWSSPLNGTTLDDCLMRMIVNSDNDCPEAFADTVKWGGVQSDIKSLGLSGTNLNTSPMVSTVNDQSLFLEKLYRGQLMKDENKNKLLDLMKRQRYRAGVPAGVPYQVADKVGFLSGLLHDSGIVYSPKGDYVISVYSDGGSWGNIADAARRIDQLLNS